ncbi:MAG: ABC-2 family transporter protein [Candidatus Zipacnadales bacterium]
MIRLPADVYSKALRATFTYVLPLVFIASIPAQTLQYRKSPLMTAAGRGPAVVVLRFARAFWFSPCAYIRALAGSK